MASIGGGYFTHRERMHARNIQITAARGGKGVFQWSALFRDVLRLLFPHGVPGRCGNCCDSAESTQENLVAKEMPNTSLERTREG